MFFGITFDSTFIEFVWGVAMRKLWINKYSKWIGMRDMCTLLCIIVIFLFFSLFFSLYSLRVERKQQKLAVMLLIGFRKYILKKKRKILRSFLQHFPFRQTHFISINSFHWFIDWFIDRTARPSLCFGQSLLILLIEKGIQTERSVFSPTLYGRNYMKVTRAITSLGLTAFSIFHIRCVHYLNTYLHCSNWDTRFVIHQ